MLLQVANLRVNRISVARRVGKNDVFTAGRAENQMLLAAFQVRAGLLEKSLNFSVDSHFTSVCSFWFAGFAARVPMARRVPSL